MPYLVVIAKSAVRVNKKFLPVIKGLIVIELEALAKNPYQAALLTGTYSSLALA